MVINHQNRWLFLGPPKTGTTTLTYLLTDGHDWNIRKPLPQKRFGGVRHAGQHAMDVSPECRGYFIFASIRNPFTRAVSLWRHWNSEGRQMKPCRAWMPFDDFVAHILCGSHTEPPAGAGEPSPVDPFFYFTLSRWFQGVPRIDRLIRQESLEADLNALGLAAAAAVPRFNQARAFNHTGAETAAPRTTDWRALYTAETEAHVRQWAQEDFDRFGYSDSLVPFSWDEVAGIASSVREPIRH